MQIQSRNAIPLALVLILALSAAGCAAPGARPGATGTPAQATVSPSLQPTPLTPGPTLPVTAEPTETVPLATPAPSPSSPTGALIALNDYRYRLIAQFGAPFYCDPDEYPVAREVTPDEVAQRVAALQKNPAEYEAILRHLGLAGTASLTPQQQAAVYAESKMLNSIRLEPAGAGKYTFSLRVGTQGPQGTAISGIIDSSGAITDVKREPAFLTCPICLAANTLIDTPDGAIPVQDLRPGMPVWTVDRAGERRAVRVEETVRRPAPVGSRLVRLVLDDGRALLASPNHPTTDGRVIGDLKTGDVLDGARVASAAQAPYTDGWTYDLLPEGETGAYWANGILLGSTLAGDYTSRQ